MDLEENSGLVNTNDTIKLSAFVHAARNDLNVISMGIQSIEDLAEDPEKVKEILEVIRSGGLFPLKEKLELIQKEVLEKRAIANSDQLDAT